MAEPVKIDVIILSYAKDEELQAITIQTIDTLIKSEDPQKILFNVIVIESNKNLKPYQFEHSETIYPDVPFGYNRYMNLGIKATSNPYVCMCNNDLIFHKGWAGKILDAFDAYPGLQSANPYCDIFIYDEGISASKDEIIQRQENINKNGSLTGWCIFVKRSIFETIGLLDEQFEFWYADNDYDLTLQKYKIGHALIKTSGVTHLSCASHEALEDKRAEMTTGQRQKFENKWNKKPLIKQMLSLLANKLK